MNHSDESGVPVNGAVNGAVNAGDSTDIVRLSSDMTDDNDDLYGTELVAPHPDRTLLPYPIANAVSFATRSTSFALRLGTFIGGFGIGAAKFTTLSSLELSRGILEGILRRAGKDVADSSRSELGRADAESMLEKSLEALHQTMTHVIFLTATSFHATGTTVSAMSDFSQAFLTVLEQFFGSNDSSRAIASIITLVRREFQNPATGEQGEKVGVVDLILGICGLAYLQNWCHKLIQQDIQRLRQEEVIWDIVVPDEPERLHSHELSLYGSHRGNYNQSQSVQGGDSFTALDRIDQPQPHTQEQEEPEVWLKEQFIASLPEQADISISTSTTITKTITVEVKGTSVNPVLALPGLDIIESEVTNPGGGESFPEGEEPTYKVVYRFSRNTTRNVENDERRHSRVEVLDDEEESDPDKPPPVPLKDTVMPVRDREDAKPPPPRKPEPQISVPTDAASPGPKNPSSQIPMPVPPTENAANQKRTRKALETRPIISQAQSSAARSAKRTKDSESPVPKPGDQKKGGIRGALKKGPVPSFSNLLNKDGSSDNIASPTTNKPKPPPIKPPWGSNKPVQSKTTIVPARGPIPDRNSSLGSPRDAPRPPKRGNPNYFSSRDLGAFSGDGPKGHNRSESRSSFISISHQRRDSFVSQTDTFSVHSFDSRPTSPALHRAEFRQSGEYQHSSLAGVGANGTGRGAHGHNRGHSHVDSLYSPSIYTLKTATGSQNSLVAAHSSSSYPYPRNGLHTSPEALESLRRTGYYQTSQGAASSSFPDFHLLRNITRYSRFASAAYGSHFLRFMQMSSSISPNTAAAAVAAQERTAGMLEGVDKQNEERSEESRPSHPHHDDEDIRHFTHHADLPPSSILLSSFVEPSTPPPPNPNNYSGGGGAPLPPLVHTIALDAPSRAIVLAIRGTLGIGDVLADLACAYDEIVWPSPSPQEQQNSSLSSCSAINHNGHSQKENQPNQKAAVTAINPSQQHHQQQGRRKAPKTYKVHEGIHAAAHRLLYGPSSRVLVALRAALEEFPDYGLVLCGHSLGGAVASLLGVMLAVPTSSSSSSSFVTAPSSPSLLPPNRSIHVYTYGPPATMSPSLRRDTRGLITSVVHGNDVVPHLSLGTLHDVQSLALAFKRDNGAAKEEVRRRVWARLKEGVRGKWYAGEHEEDIRRKERGGEDEESYWAYAALKTLRASMMNAKLVPPGEVFCVEGTPALRRERWGGGGGGGGEDGQGEGDDKEEPRKGTRLVFKYVRDVEARFREIKFGASMLVDHSPARYEEALRKLAGEVCR